MSSNTYIEQLLNIEVPCYYISRLEEINAVLGQQQLETIMSTLALIQNNSKELESKIDQITINNIQKCNNWCIKNNVGFHKIMSPTSSADFLFEKRGIERENKYKLYVNPV